MKILSAMYIDDTEGNHQAIQVTYQDAVHDGQPEPDPIETNVPLDGSGWMNHALADWLAVPGNSIAPYTAPTPAS